MERMIDPKLSHQIELEKLYNKNNTLSRISKEFTHCKEFNFAKYMGDNDIDEQFGFDLLTQMVLHKRTTLPTLVGILRRHFDGRDNACQLAADMLQVCAKADLVDWNPVTRQFIVKFDISQDVQDDLDRYQFPLPMVIEPRKVNDNRDTGYVMSRNSIILRRNHHEDDVCLDHINRVNAVRFTINYDTAHMVRNQWRNLDKPKTGETKQDFQKRLKAFEKYDRSSKEIIDLILRYGNEFYLTHKYDKRGRIYCQGYHINYAGNAWNKAVIELADKEIVP